MLSLCLSVRLVACRSLGNFEFAAANRRFTLLFPCWFLQPPFGRLEIVFYSFYLLRITSDTIAKRDGSA